MSAFIGLSGEAVSLGQQIFMRFRQKVYRVSSDHAHTASPRRVIPITPLQSQLRGCDLGEASAGLCGVWWSSGRDEVLTSAPNWSVAALCLMSQSSFSTHTEYKSGGGYDVVSSSPYIENNEAAGSHDAWLAESPLPSQPIKSRTPAHYSLSRPAHIVVRAHTVWLHLMLI